MTLSIQSACLVTLSNLLQLLERMALSLTAGVISAKIRIHRKQIDVVYRQHVLQIHSQIAGKKKIGERGRIDTLIWAVVLGVLCLVLWLLGGSPAHAQGISPSMSPISPPMQVGGQQSQQQSPVKTLAETTSQFKESNWDLGSNVELAKTPYVVRAGTVIPATLITGINSQLPGMVRAQVSQNVYDTATGNYVMIPQGSQLIGEYSTGVAYGQSRVMVTWKRITFPDARVLDIGTMPGTDVGGASGFADQVNNHYLRTFGSAILLSAIAGGISYAVDKNSPVNNSAGGSTVTAQGEVASQTGNTVGTIVNSVMQKNLNLAPTIMIRSGYPFDVLATKDITMQVPYANVYRQP
jgi:type IV secretory pathway VirB10-like protein